MCTSPHPPRTSDTCYETHVLLLKMYFRRAVFHMAQFKRFPNLILQNKKKTKKIAIEIAHFKFIVIAPNSQELRFTISNISMLSDRLY